MKSRRAIIYSTAVLGGQVAGVVRTLLIARLIGLENQGLVILLQLVISLIESCLTLGNSWQAVQAEEGEDPDFISSLHAFNLVRGVFVAGIILASGPVIARVTGIEGLILPLAVLSLSSVVRGFTSLGPWLSLREHRIQGLTILEVAPAVSGLTAVGLFSFFTDDIWLFVFAQLASAVSVVIASHLVSDLRYRLKVRPDYVMTILRFALPLTGAGILYWANLRGDQMIILFGADAESQDALKAQLGIYGTAFGLSLMAAGACSKVLQAVIVPNLSRRNGDDVDFRAEAMRLRIGSLAVASGLVIGALLVGPRLLVLTLGAKYEPANPLFSAIALIVGLQFGRRFFYLVAMSRGCTKTMFVGNLLRFCGIGFAALFFTMGFGLAGLAWGGVLGELTAFCGLLGSSLLRRSMSLRGSFGYLTVLGIAFLLARGFEGLLPSTAGMVIGGLAGIAAGAWGLLWMTRERAPGLAVT